MRDIYGGVLAAKVCLSGEEKVQSRIMGRSDGI